MQSLFKPGAKINQDHKHKYIHILAYAASVVETWKKVPSVLRTCGLRPVASSALALCGALGARTLQPAQHWKCLYHCAQDTERAQCPQELCGVFSSRTHYWDETSLCLPYCSPMTVV